MRRQLNCDTNVGEQWMGFLERHSGVHLRADWARTKADTRFAFSPRYALAYSALKEFALAGGLSQASAAIGPLALLSTATSTRSLSHLCRIVEQECGERFDLDEFGVGGYAIQGGSCVVITLPYPTVAPEAYMVGVVTDVDLSIATAERPAVQPRVHYFSLERTQYAPPVLCGWQLLGRPRKNYGRQMDPNLTDFLDAVEDLWVTGEWKIEEN